MISAFTNGARLCSKRDISPEDLSVFRFSIPLVNGMVSLIF
jgi:hypothetical protein